MSAPRTNGQGVSESGASHGGDISKQRSWAQTLVVLLAIAAAVGVALYTLRPPEVVPANAPTTEFSAERAMKDLKILAKGPRPVGSQGHAEAQRYILKEIRALGLGPRVQTTTAMESFPRVVPPSRRG